MIELSRTFQRLAQKREAAVFMGKQRQERILSVFARHLIEPNVEQ